MVKPAAPPSDLPLPPKVWAWLLATLRGERPAWPRATTHLDEARLIQVGDEAGIVPLLWDGLRGSGECPSSLRDALESRALLEAVMAQTRQTTTRRVLHALAAAGVSALVFKGAALAQVVYARPDLRPACDVDILLAQNDWPRAEVALRDAGYQSVMPYFHQVTLVHNDASPLAPYVDIHWSVSEQSIFRRVFTLDELFGRSMPLPALGETARTVGQVDALLLACAHFAQHRQWQRLIWLYDIHLLAGRLSTEDVLLFMQLARSKRLQSVCRTAMQQAGFYFGEPSANPLLVDFIQAETRGWRYAEPSAHLLAQRNLLLHDFMLEMRSRNWRERVNLLRRIVLQPADIRRLDGWTPPAPLQPLVRGPPGRDDGDCQEWSTKVKQ